LDDKEINVMENKLPIVEEKITCPVCSVASTLKGKEEIIMFFDLVKKALDKDTNVQIFLARKKQNLKG
jgi:hypothetical protein